MVLGEALNLWIPAEQIILGLAVWLVFFACACLRAGKAGRRPVFLFAVFLTAAGIVSGSIRMEAEQRIFRKEERFFAEQQEHGAVLSGTVRSLREKDGTLELVLENCVSWEETGETGQTFRQILCYLDLDEGTGSLAAGKRIRVSGKTKAADPARNPGVFDYRLYCRAKGISGIIYADGYTVTGGKIRVFPDFLYRCRRALTGQFKRIALPEDAEILSAVLFGEKADLDAEIYELYRKNGISHLLAISGLHVSIVGLGIWKLFRKGGTGFWISGFLAGGFLYAYGSMVGFGPSVVRAVTMAGLSFLAAAVGRTYDLPTAMCIPAAGLLMARPYLITQASFQLSFLAVAALVYPGRLFHGLQKRGKQSGMADGTDEKRGVSVIRHVKHVVPTEAFFTSLSVWMVTAPVILWHSFGLPPYGILLNLLVIPLMTYVVLSGFLGLSLSFVSEAIGGAMLGGAHYILECYRILCEKTGTLPGAELAFGQPEVWQIAGYYLLLMSGAVLFEHWETITAGEKRFCVLQGMIAPAKNGRRKGVEMWKNSRLPVLCMFWLLACSVLLPICPSGLSVTFLDVGQGDGILLRSSSKTILVDCGSSQLKTVGEKVLVPHLKSQGVTKLDLAVMTHGDQDHINGIRYLLEHPECGIQIGGLVLPAAGNGEIYETMAALAGKRMIPVYRAGTGDVWKNALGTGISMTCLSPEAEETFADRNEESLVFLVKFDRFSMLLTGDMEEAGEERLVQENILSPVTVLKAGHHGSDTSSGEPFLTRVSPKIAVLSYGRGNRYGHPAESVKERLENHGAELLETGTQGAVMIRTDGRKVKIRTMLAEEES